MLQFKQMKYVIFELGDIENPIIIPYESCLEHADVSIQNRMGIEGKVVSAGFVGFGNKGITCWGESISLGVKSRQEEDAELINRRFCYNF